MTPDLDIYNAGVQLKTRELESIPDFMNRCLYMSSADGGGKWIHRPDQYGTSLLQAHPDVKEFCYIAGTQEGKTQQGGASAIQDVLNGYSTVFYSSNDTKAREATTRIFNHWIDSVPEVMAEFLYDKSTQKSPGNDLNKKPFLDATLYSLGAASAANTASITVQRGYVDEPDRIKGDIGDEGGIIGLLSGRFRAIPSGKLSVYGSPTGRRGRIWKYLSSFKHVFECYWPCPHCNKMHTADFGSAEHDYGFKWDTVFEADGKTIDCEATAQSAHYICQSCKGRIHEHEFRDALKACEWFSNTGLWFDTREGKGEFKAKNDDGTWRIVKAPAKVAARKTKDGVGLYSMTSWIEGCRGWLEALNYYYVTGDADELLKPMVNTWRGTIWESKSQSHVEANVVLELREELGKKIPDCIDRLGLQIDFQKRFCKYLIVGFAKNGQKTDLYGLQSKRIDGRTEDPDAQMWGKLSTVATAEYEREDGTMLQIGRVIADAGHEPENVIKWCSEDPKHRIGVFGRPGTVGGQQRTLFDYDADDPDKQFKTYTIKGKDYSALGVPINPHKASKRVYRRLEIAKGEPGAWHFAATDDFNQDFADEAVADKHSRKKDASGEYYDHYEKENDSDAGESHDNMKYAEINLFVQDKFGTVTPKMIEKKSTSSAPVVTSGSVSDLIADFMAS